MSTSRSMVLSGRPAKGFRRATDPTRQGFPRILIRYSTVSRRKTYAAIATGKKTGVRPLPFVRGHHGWSRTSATTTSPAVASPLSACLRQAAPLCPTLPPHIDRFSTTPSRMGFADALAVDHDPCQAIDCIAKRAQSRTMRAAIFRSSNRCWAAQPAIAELRLRVEDHRSPQTNGRPSGSQHIRKIAWRQKLIFT